MIHTYMILSEKQLNKQIKCYLILGCHQETKGQEKGRLKIKPQMAMKKKDLKMAMTKMDTVKIPVPQFNLSFRKF